MIHVVSGTLVRLLSGTVVHVLSGTVVQVLSGTVVHVVSGTVVQVLSGTVVDVMSGIVVQVVSVPHSHSLLQGEYGEKGISSFTQLATKSGICIGRMTALLQVSTPFSRCLHHNQQKRW